MFKHIRKLFNKKQSMTLDEVRYNFHRDIVKELRSSVSEHVTIGFDDATGIIYIYRDESKVEMTLFSGEINLNKIEVTLMVEDDGWYEVGITIILTEDLLKSYLTYQTHLIQTVSNNL